MQGHRARKRFGQNFLVDTHYIDRIIDAVAPRPGDNLVEIGPGLGALTHRLIERATRIAAIEIDRDLAARLRETWGPTRLALHEGDALAFDYAVLGENLRVVGNLPYNISSPLLFHLASFDSLLRDIHVMLQREVVARMAAAPGTSDYGRLSVMLQAKFAVARLFIIPPGAFQPAPKVDSAFVRLVPLGAARPAITDERLFSRVVGAAFGQRRKTLRNTLKGVLEDADYAALGIDPQIRAEQLDLASFIRLADRTTARQRDSA